MNKKTGNLHIWKGSINAERYTQVLEKDFTYFNRTMLKHILHPFQQHGFIVEESGCWTDLPAVQNFHHLKTFEIQQRRPRTAEPLESSIRQEWDNSPLPKVQQLVSSVPDVYRLLLKEEWMLHSGKHIIIMNKILICVNIF